MHALRTLTRRHALLTALGAAATTLAQAQTAQPKELAPCSAPNQARTAIHYDLEFNATPQRFYEALLDQKQFAACSAMPATIDRTVGGAFQMFGAQIEGRTVELVANQRIVQAWRPAHWDPGIYSIVHFELKPTANGTALSFNHNGFPAGDYDHLDWGWKNHYWETLKKYLA
jgi:activator of HSP90 ATPase